MMAFSLFALVLSPQLEMCQRQLVSGLDIATTSHVVGGRGGFFLRGGTYRRCYEASFEMVVDLLHW